MAEKIGIEAKFLESIELIELAAKIIAVKDDVAHVDVSEVLFLKEMETVPRAAARCYSFFNHPVKFFTEKKFCIVFYESNIDYFTEKQRAILMYHELKHIPLIGNKLVKHSIEDFYEVLQMGIDWSNNGADVPDILKKEETNNGRK